MSHHHGHHHHGDHHEHHHKHGEKHEKRGQGMAWLGLVLVVTIFALCVAAMLASKQDAVPPQTPPVIELTPTPVEPPLVPNDQNPPGDSDSVHNGDNGDHSRRGHVSGNGGSDSNNGWLPCGPGCRWYYPAH